MEGTQGFSWKNLAPWSAGPVAFCVILVLPLGLSPSAHQLAALLGWVVFWWMLEPIPLPVTAVLAAEASVVLGIAKPQAAFAPFADPVIFLFMGGFLLARAMEVHGTDRWLAHRILALPGVRGRTWPTLIALMGVTAFLSMWISNTASTVIMLPVALGIGVRIFGSGESTASARGFLVLGVAYASSIGGISTPVGSPPNAVALGMLERITGARIGFLSWMSVGVPCAIALLAVWLLLLKWTLGHELVPNQAPAASESELEGSLTRDQALTLFAGSVAIALWLAPDLLALTLGAEASWPRWVREHVPESVTSILSASLLFVFPSSNPSRAGSSLLRWSEAQRIDWGTLLLFGGGLSLGSLMFQTGLSDSIGALLPGVESWIFLPAMIALTLFWTELSSNTATANMLIPLVIAASQSSPSSTPSLVMACALISSLGFMMPVGTPPNAIAYGSGLVSIRTMMRLGLVMNLIAALAVWAIILWRG
jgi:sodium-dependent dicarboxylate transporter 2/3/5